VGLLLIHGRWRLQSSAVSDTDLTGLLEPRKGSIPVAEIHVDERDLERVDESPRRFLLKRRQHSFGFPPVSRKGMHPADAFQHQPGSRRSTDLHVRSAAM
jgi:hypothetical protein